MHEVMKILGEYFRKIDFPGRYLKKDLNHSKMYSNL